MNYYNCSTDWSFPLTTFVNRIDGVMVSVLNSSAIDHVFEPWSGQTKDYKIGICCFSAKHTALRRKSKDWWGDMSIHGLYIINAIILLIYKETISLRHN